MKIGWATVGMMAVGQGVAPTPLTVAAPGGKGALLGELAAPLRGVGTGFGPVATVEVIVAPQGWVGNPPTPEGLVVPAVLCPAEAPWVGVEAEGDWLGFWFVLWLGVVVVLWLGNVGALWLGVAPAGVGVLWTPVAVVWELAVAGAALSTKANAALPMARAHRARAIPAGFEFPRMIPA